MAAFGFLKKQFEEERQSTRVNIDAPFAFALGANYRTNKATLRDLSESGARIEIPISEEIPDLDFFYDIPMAFRLPGDNATWRCNVDIVRIYTRNERSTPVYGMAINFKNISKEQKENLRNYLDARRGKTPQ